MSVQSVALASLVANYSDSEAEEDAVDDGSPCEAAAPHDNQVGQPRVTISPMFAKSASNSPDIPLLSQTNYLNVLVNNAKRVNNAKPQLVSNYDPDNSFACYEEVNVIADTTMPITEDLSSELSPDDLLLDSLIPPEPEGQYPLNLQEKFSALHSKMQAGKLDLNCLIQEKKEFNNPSIYSKLISYCSINELGTNYAPEQFDPFKWGQESYHEELAKAQDSVMERLAKKIEGKVTAVNAAKRTTVAEAIESLARKNGRWDQAATAAPASTKTTVTNASSQKCNVTVAFGSVQKRRVRHTVEN